MVSQKIIDRFPVIYSSFLPEFFNNPIHREELADCTACPMCLKPGESREPGRKYYSPETKCCTYYPNIPNYLVGAILSDKSPDYDEGRLRIQERIRNHIAATPQGLLEPFDYYQRFAKKAVKGFGMNTSLLCPYYNRTNGKCSVWMIRTSVCLSFLCRTMGHEYGDDFWFANRMYFLHLENTLAYYALYKMDFDPLNIMNYSIKSNGDEPIPKPAGEGKKPDSMGKTYETLWEKWAGKEEDLYRETFRIIANLTPEDFDSITDIKLTLLLKNIKKKYDIVMSPEYQRVIKFYSYEKKLLNSPGQRSVD
ncbi:hypothetical protein ACFL60_03245 [Candidatus Omnitrophota bacterium]